MKTPKSAIFLPLVILICCVSTSSQQSRSETSPANWKKIQPLKYFTFYLPNHAWDTEWSSIDEIYKEYRIRKMRFTLTYDPRGVTAYDRREQKFGKFEERIIEVGGKKAYLYNYVQILRGRKRYHTDLYVGDFPNGEVELWMTADSWRPEDLEVAQRIFSTIEFIKP